MPKFTLRKPFYVFIALLVLGLFIISAGFFTGNLIGRTPDSGMQHASKKADSGAASPDASTDITRYLSGAGNNDAADTIDKTPLGSVPHKALYDITMIEKHGGARISNVSGRMAFEWRPACAGWLSRHRFSLVYEYPDNPGARVVSRYETLEAYDGRRMDFTSQRWRDGEKLDEYRGQAIKLADGNGYKVTYNAPAGASFEMPGEVMFPMEHTFALLRAARKGETFFSRPVFDGHDNEGPVDINAFIGNTVNAMAHIQPSKAIDTALVNTKAWHVRMAFFPALQKTSTPDYELSAHLHENGVISRMRVAYDKFTIRQELVALEKLKLETCE